MIPRKSLLMMLCVTFAGCGQHTATAPGTLGAVAAAGAPASTPVQQPDGSAATAPAIAWYSGSVEAAFAAAREQNKPVFLYWGASWCPPCHELKATVFSRPDFIEKLKLFIPVYLDGDNPGAQKWGDSFGVSGYPTVLVLSADHSELARISGGLDLSQYAQVLDTVLGDVRPVSIILAGLSSGGARPLSRDDCHRLAFYGWDVADQLNHNAAALAQTLSQAAARCPADSPNDRARLILAAATFAASGEEGALTAGKPPSPRLIRLIGQVDQILNNAPQSAQVADAFGGLNEAFFRAAARNSPDQASAWYQRFAAVMDSAAGDARFSAADHLYFLYSKLVAAKAMDPQHKVPAQLSAQAHQRIDAALAAKLDEHSRASVVNAAQNILDVVGDEERAYAITREQMALSKFPYYYMPDLAQFEEKRGHLDAAVDWLAKSYQASQGSATRFQWGVRYIRGLIRMKPNDDAAIRSAGLEVLGELDGPDRIYQRTRSGLEGLGRALESWNAKGDHTATIAALRERMAGICSQLPKNDSAAATCRGFLSKNGSVST